MLKILFINDYPAVRGGADQVAITEAASLAAAGHSVRFACSLPCTIDERLSSAGVEVCSPPSMRTGEHRVSPLRGLWNAPLSQWLRQIIENPHTKPDVIHIHGWTKGFSPSLFAALDYTAIPYVCTLHDYVVACPNGALYDFGSNSICRRRPLGIGCLSCNCDRIGRKEKYWRITRQFLAKYRARIPSRLPYVINVSHFSQRILSEFMPATTSCRVLGNPIAVAQRPRVATPNGAAFCFVGRFVQEKGVETLAKASVLAGAKVRFVGAGEYESRIRQIAPAAEIVGWRTASEVHSIMQSSLAVVFPSTWYECQPLVPLEAAALGVSSIVSDSCAAVESVDDGVTGFHFKGGSAEDLAVKLARAMEPGQADRLGAAAYDGFWNRASDPASHAVQLVEIYSAMLSGKRISD